MRNSFTKAFLLTIVLFLLACNKEEYEMIGPFAGSAPALYDAGRVQNVVCYAMDTVDLRLQREGYFNPTPDEAKRFDSIRQAAVHLPMSYDNVCIRFALRTSEDMLEMSYNSEKEKKGVEKYNQFVQKVSNKVRPSISQRQELEQLLASQGVMNIRGLYPFFFTARITGAPIITASRVLFGQQAGTDLSSHFVVEGASLALPQGAFTDFGFFFWYDAVERPTSLSDYFAQDTWLQSSYVFRFRDVPEEEYEDLTLNISLPVACEYWYEYYRMGLNEVRREQRTLEASSVVRIGQISKLALTY